jgi:hypothetical protein
MSVLHRPQPPWSVPAPPGSVIEADSSEGTETHPRSTARDRGHTPLYGVPILARKDETPRYAELGETTEVASAVVGEIRVEAHSMRPAAPSKTVVVDPKLRAAVVPAAGPRRGRGRLVALGVGGVALLAIVIWVAVGGRGNPRGDASAEASAPPTADRATAVAAVSIPSAEEASSAPAEGETDHTASAARLLAEARKASMAGRNQSAWELASRSYAVERTAKALQVMGIAACKMGDRRKAHDALDLLPDPRRRALVAVCAAHGVEL